MQQLNYPKVSLVKKIPFQSLFLIINFKKSALNEFIGDEEARKQMKSMNAKEKTFERKFANSQTISKVF